MAKNKSINNICGDGKISLSKRFVFYTLNALNILFPNNNLDNSLIIKHFKYTTNRTYDYEDYEILNSPSRRLSNLFWYQLPWERIKKSLGKLNVLDIGCGPGLYANKFMFLSNYVIDKYVGLGVKDFNEWEKIKKNNKIGFQNYDGNNIKPILKDDLSMIISQSAIEHIKYDLSVFNQICEFVKANKKEFLQIHLIHAESALFTYGKHGYRQYTPRTISKITKLFSPFSQCTLYKLGGKNSNRVHFKYITFPNLFLKSDHRYKKCKEYIKARDEAIKRDLKENKGSASFYALVIHSYPKQEIIK